MSKQKHEHYPSFQCRLFDLPYTTEISNLCARKDPLQSAPNVCTHASYIEPGARISPI